MVGATERVVLILNYIKHTHNYSSEMLVQADLKVRMGKTHS